MGKQKILIVDDSEINRALLAEILEEQYEITEAEKGSEAISLLSKRRSDFSLLLLDIIMPDMNGFELCTSIRQFSSVPIIFLSCYTENDDKIKGFLSGADDYVPKPFSLKELELRVNVRILRRYENQPPELLTFGDLIIDTGRLTAICHGVECTFPRLEFDILSFFAHHPNQLFTYEQLYDNIWKQPINESRHNLQARIGKVRKKLCDICPEKEYIRTIRHKGYLFVP